MNLIVDQPVNFKIPGLSEVFTGLYVETHKMTGELLLAVGANRRYIQPAAVVEA